MKKIMIVWAFIAVVLVGGLTYLGLNIKKQNEPYKNLEAQLEKQAIALVGEKPSLLKSNSKLTIEDLKNNGYEINSIINGDVCDGYVLISQNLNFYKYESYIKCPNYMTKGYN